MDHSLLSITLKGKTKELHPCLVSISGVPSPGIQSPSSSPSLQMGSAPNLGELTPLRSRPYHPESVSDQPAPETYPFLILFPGFLPQTHTVPVCPSIHCWALPSTQADFIYSGAGHTSQNCIPLWFLLPGSLPQAHAIPPYPWPHCWALTPTPVDFLHSETCHTSQNQCK